MWPPWTKSPRRTTTLQTQISSFKDIQSLIQDDPKQQQQKRIHSIFHRVRFAKSLIKNWSASSPRLLPPPPPPPEPTISVPGIVVYFTSLRIVRRTYEDCRTARTILRGFRVSIDERDLAMDAGLLEELKLVLGVKRNEPLALPRVFIGGRYIGGAEEIRQLHEIGELKKIVEGFPKAEAGVCDQCGGHRFVLCDLCNGSHKCYMEIGGGFRSCLACNENGLVRCPLCSFTQN